MLCRRSASLISTTRTSVTMASSILRTFSAWRSSRLANWILSILVTPSTMCATWSPKSGVDFLAGGGRVFDRVVQQAGGDGRRVQLHLRQHFGHFERMNDVGLAGGAHLALMMLDAELPGLANEGDVFAGTVGLDLRSRASKRWSMACRSALGTRQSCALPRGRAGARWEHLPVWAAGQSPCFIIGRFGSTRLKEGKPGCPPMQMHGCGFPKPYSDEPPGSELTASSRFANQ